MWGERGECGEREGENLKREGECEEKEREGEHGESVWGVIEYGEG